MIATTFAWLLHFAWALGGHSAVAPRKSLEKGIGGATMLRRETSETKSSEEQESQTAAATPSATPPNRFVTKKTQVDVSGDGTHGGWHGGTMGSDEFTIHSCSTAGADACNFDGCGGSNGATGMCQRDNCYAQTDDSSCKNSDGTNVADGTLVASASEEFCFGGMKTKICPPNSCQDFDTALDGTTCAELNILDATFCQKPDLQSMISVFCRYTCGIMTRPTCAHASGAASCPSNSLAKDDTSAECSDCTCDVTSGYLSADFSVCCTEKAQCGENFTCPEINGVQWVPNPAMSSEYCASTTCYTDTESADDTSLCCQEP